MLVMLLKLLHFEEVHDKGKREDSSWTRPHEREREMSTELINPSCSAVRGVVGEIERCRCLQSDSSMTNSVFSGFSHTLRLNIFDTH